MSRFRRSNPSSNEFFNGQHRFEHWYRDNSVYFITARCRDRHPSFASERAKEIFWDRFTYYTTQYAFSPFLTSLLGNHYHTLGYLKTGDNLGPLMRKLHGSVAKLVNDILPERQVPFGCENHHDNYFDGCIRDEQQLRRAYRYTFTQCVRHRVHPDPLTFPHTRVTMSVEDALELARIRSAYMRNVPYPRYQRR